MMMMGLYRTDVTPFTYVYLHGMILAPDGSKMSKSRGNTVEPSELFDQYGADALRLWYFTDTLPGQNTPVRPEKLKGNRNFVNKIWNASRYVMMQAADLNDDERKELGNIVVERIGAMSTSSDEWDKETYENAKSVSAYLDGFRFNLAVEAVREFFWHQFCDMWIEETKSKIQKDESNKKEFLGQLIAILAVQMKLLHPFAPFVTERVWQSLCGLGLLPGEQELLMGADWPVTND
jgi:valyl-tRNA synthetase